MSVWLSLASLTRVWYVAAKTIWHVSQIAVDGSVSIRSMFRAMTSVCELLPPLPPPRCRHCLTGEFCPTQPATARVLTINAPNTLAVRGAAGAWLPLHSSSAPVPLTL